MDEYAAFVDWVVDSSDQALFTDRSLMAEWLRPNFQNYTTGEEFFINANGKALRELVMFLSARHETAAHTRPEPGSTRRILLVTRYAPSMGHAGGLRILDLYTQLRRLNSNLVIDLYAPSEPHVDGNVDALKEVFDRIYWTTMARFSYGDFLIRAGSAESYDLVDAQFHDAGRLLPQFKPISSRRLFTPMECLSRAAFERMQMSFSLRSALKLASVFETIQTTRDELKLIATADETICVSEADADFLKKIAGKNQIDFVPTGLSEREFSEQLKSSYPLNRPSSRAKRLVFAAYFGSDTNVDGLRWYVNEVHSQVLSAVPDYKLMVVGRGNLDWLRNENRPGISIVGEVPELGPVLSQARGGLVLALHGSGFRGKINQYAICGVPSISTSLGMTGLCYVPGENIIRADSPGEFAVECIRVLCDGGYADRIGERARHAALANYSWSNLMGRVRDVYAV
jgi:hypothetical protein